MIFQLICVGGPGCDLKVNDVHCSLLRRGWFGEVCLILKHKMIVLGWIWNVCQTFQIQPKSICACFFYRIIGTVFPRTWNLLTSRSNETLDVMRRVVPVYNPCVLSRQHAKKPQWVHFLLCAGPVDWSTLARGTTGRTSAAMMFISSSLRWSFLEFYRWLSSYIWANKWSKSLLSSFCTSIVVPLLTP